MVTISRSANQKLKLLYLAQILLEQTDEEHPLTVQDLIAQLAQYDIQAERKSIYDDLDALSRFGLDGLSGMGYNIMKSEGISEQ